MKKGSKKIYVIESKIHNKGIFAVKNIKRCEIVFIIKGKKIKFLIDNEERAKIAGLNWIGIGKNEWINPVNHGLFINHSCNPNSAILGRVAVVATRNIKKGEEVTFDYSFSEADIFWHVKCRCGNKNCRKIIKSIQFLPHKIFTQYKNSAPKYFQKVYEKFNVSNFKNKQEFRGKWVNFIKKDFNV